MTVCFWIKLIVTKKLAPYQFHGFYSDHWSPCSRSNFYTQPASISSQITLSCHSCDNHLLVTNANVYPCSGLSLIHNIPIHIPLQSLLRNSSLKELNLAANDLNQNAAIYFAHVLAHNKTLTHLDLSNNQLGVVRFTTVVIVTILTFGDNKWCGSWNISSIFYRLPTHLIRIVLVHRMAVKNSRKVWLEMELCCILIYVSPAAVKRQNILYANKSRRIKIICDKPGLTILG